MIWLQVLFDFFGNRFWFSGGSITLNNLSFTINQKFLNRVGSVTGFTLRFIKNVTSKFHLTRFKLIKKGKWYQLTHYSWRINAFTYPKIPGWDSFIHFHKGASLSPLTSLWSDQYFILNKFLSTYTLEVKGKVTFQLREQKFWISSSEPGSWPPNWLQGDPTITKPLSLYFW